jgi:hypothetical protein
MDGYLSQSFNLALVPISKDDRILGVLVLDVGGEHFLLPCHVTIQKQKEITEAAAQQNQPKQVMHTASYHSPYIPKYVGNHPAASAASASQPQASWKQPPPPLQPAYSRGQQPEGSQQTHQQRDFREESEARTVNSTVPESKHIY